MDSKKKLLKKLRKEVMTLEKHIEKREKYNLKNKLIRTVIDTGITIEYLFPYILSSLIMFQVNLYDGDNPLKRDIVYDNKQIEITKTSSGVQFDKVFDEYDKSSNDEFLEYSSSWTINEYGLYEREIVSYQIDDIELNDDILNMTKQELDDSYQVIDIKEISKNILTDEDELYNENLVVIKKISEYIDLESRREESIFEMIGSFIIYSGTTFLGGKVIKLVKKKYIKGNIEEKLELLKQNYPILEEKDIENIEKIIKLKKNNLLLFDDDVNDRKLIKRKVNYDV